MPLFYEMGGMEFGSLLSWHLVFKVLIKGAYWIIQRFLVHYQILHLSNIGLFSFASYKVIALQTIATAIVVALTRS